MLWYSKTVELAHTTAPPCGALRAILTKHVPNAIFRHLLYVLQFGVEAQCLVICAHANSLPSRVVSYSPVSL